MRLFEERLAGTLMGAMAVLGGAAASVAWILGYPGVARGTAAGAALAVAYLGILWRYVRAFLARAKGERLTPLDRLTLGGGMTGRLLLAGAVLAAIAQRHPTINLWAAIIAFLSYRLVLGAYELTVLVRSRREPIPPPLGWQSEDDRFPTREKRDIGRRRSRHQGR